jgi:integrase
MTVAKSDVDPVAFERWRRRRLQTASRSTVDKQLAAFGGMFRCARRRRLSHSNPMETVHALREGEAFQKRPRRALTDDEIEQLLLAAVEADRLDGEGRAAVLTIAGGTKGSGYAARDPAPRVLQAPLWMSLLETGARWGELTRTTWGDLDEERRTLTLRAENTKGRRTRRV